MNTGRLTRHTVVAVVVGLLTLVGCGSTGGDKVDKAAVEKVADKARGYIDDFAAMLGTNPKVGQDVLSDCVPGNGNSGKLLIYDVRVSTEPGTRDRLLTEVRQKWESRGWTAKTDGATDLRLLKDSFSMGATVSSDGKIAAVGGSSGCLD